jgi:hypothetical protein
MCGNCPLKLYAADVQQHSMQLKLHTGAELLQKLIMPARSSYGRKVSLMPPRLQTFTNDL